LTDDTSVRNGLGRPIAGFHDHVLHWTARRLAVECGISVATLPLHTALLLVNMSMRGHDAAAAEGACRVLLPWSAV
jgi:hypothetical protein